MTDTLARFQGKVAVITGGARGIGRACARRFATEGARVALLDLDPGQASSTAREIKSLGQQALAIHCDVRDEGQLAAAVEQVMAAWGRIDIWLNNAGAYTGGPLVEVPLADWDQTVGVNLTGTYLGCRAVAPIMRQQGFGRIINVSSLSAAPTLAGAASRPELAAYSASKAAVIGLTRSVALDLAPFGITVNAVCPGDTWTSRVRDGAAAAARQAGIPVAEWLHQRARGNALGRLARPEEIAGPVAFLASEEARYFTGQAISIDGGRALQGGGHEIS